MRLRSDKPKRMQPWESPLTPDVILALIEALHESRIPDLRCGGGANCYSARRTRDPSIDGEPAILELAGRS